MKRFFGVALLTAYLQLLDVVVGKVNKNTLILTRSADDGSITSSLNFSQFLTKEDPEEETPCKFTGGDLVFAHPMDLHPNDKYFDICNLFQKGYELMVDYINNKNCGVLVQGLRYSITLQSYGEDSSKEKAAAIARAIEPTTDFFLAPYTSSISEGVSAVANETNKIMIAPGSYFTSVYENRPASFGVLPLPNLYLLQVLPMLQAAGAKTIHTVYEGGPGKQCESIVPPDGMILQGASPFETGPTKEDFLPLAQNLSMPENDPDVVVTCTYDAACKEWVYAMREVNWSPRAQVFSICIGLETFEEAVGTDAEYLIGMSPWDRSLSIKDSLSGWSPEEFASLFETYSGRSAAYHAALGQATISLIAQAIESSNSLETADVANALQTQTFETAFGKVSFDGNGQNKMDLIATQYNGDSTVEVVYPPEVASTSLIYPMPTWANRDCVRLSECGKINGAYSGKCNSDGTCVCASKSANSFGIGPTAECHEVPVEDYTYIGVGNRVVGYIFVAIQCLSSILCIVWTLHYQNNNVVKMSQPIFLVLIAFGCMVMSISIIPLTIEGDYRYEQNSETGLVTNNKNRDIIALDAACMAFPWLLVLGFSVTFSALFAKIIRIRRIMANSKTLRKVKIMVKDVAIIMVAIVTIESIVLLIWNLVAPLEWNREIVSTSDLGFPTKSFGSCSTVNSRKGLIFIFVLCAINFFLLLGAMWLCYITRNVHCALNEAKWITMSVISIFQILILSIPITVIANENTSASFFVKSAAIFLSSMGVTCLIFCPKFYSLHISKEEINVADVIRKSSRSLRSSTGGISAHRSSNVSSTPGSESRI
mmetsp:Transcript_13827/g.27569  ORF Transcript_13827/g.27569 Transcript_13827/m.27569 type:complete len:824 (-) Transcript_13827:377-2848(-)